MTNDEFQNLVIQHFQKVYEKLDSIEKSQTKLETRMENDVADKIKVLFEANQVQEDRYKEIMEKFGNIEKRFDDIETERLGSIEKHLDNIETERLGSIEKRLESIETDTGYLVAKVARLESLAK